MTNDIAVPTSSTVAEIDKLYAWVDIAAKTHQVAIGLAKTSFVPATMRGRPEEVTACILTGRELGFEPMAALRSIDLIDGKPVVNAMGMRAIVQAQGHELWLEESTMSIAVVCGIRKGSDHIQKSVWTVDRAQKAGLTSKKNWINHTSAMLIARATAEVCRLIAADALLAMPYSAEELRDELATDVVATEDPLTTTVETKVFRRDPDAMPPAGPVDDLADTVQAEEWPEDAAGVTHAGVGSSMEANWPEVLGEQR